MFDDEGREVELTAEERQERLDRISNPRSYTTDVEEELYATTGKSPDHTVTLPIASLGDYENEQRGALDPTKFVEALIANTKSGPYSATSQNCSEMVTRAMVASVREGDKDLESVLAERTVIDIQTPQNLMHNAMAFGQLSRDTKPGQAQTPSPPSKAKVWAARAGAATALFVGAIGVGLGKGVSWVHQKTTKHLVDAFSRKSTVDDHTAEHRSSYEGINLKNITPEDLDKVEIVEINASHPLEAIKHFQWVIASKSNQVPVFSAEVHQKIHQWLEKEATPEQQNVYHQLVAASQKKFVFYTNVGKTRAEQTAGTPVSVEREEYTPEVMTADRKALIKDFAGILVLMDKLRETDNHKECVGIAYNLINQISIPIHKAQKMIQLIDKQLETDPDNQQLLSQKKECQDILMACGQIREKTALFASANQIMALPSGAKREQLIKKHPQFEDDYQFFREHPYGAPPEIEKMKADIKQLGVEAGLPPPDAALIGKFKAITGKSHLLVSSNQYLAATDLPLDRHGLTTLMERNREAFAELQKARQELVDLRQKTPGVAGFKEQFDQLGEALKSLKQLQQKLFEVYQSQAKLAINKQVIQDIDIKMEKAGRSEKKRLAKRKEGLENECGQLQQKITEIQQALSTSPPSLSPEVDQYLRAHPLIERSVGTQSQHLAELQQDVVAHRDSGHSVSMGSEPVPTQQVATWQHGQQVQRRDQRDTLQSRDDARMRTTVSQVEFSSYIQDIQTNMPDELELERASDNLFVYKYQSQEQVVLSHSAQGEVEISAPMPDDVAALSDKQIEIMIDSAVKLNQKTGQVEFDMENFTPDDAVKVFHLLTSKGLTPVLSETQKQSLQAASDSVQDSDNRYQQVIDQSEQVEQRSSFSRGV